MRAHVAQTIKRRVEAKKSLRLLSVADRRSSLGVCMWSLSIQSVNIGMGEETRGFCRRRSIDEAFILRRNYSGNLA